MKTLLGFTIGLLVAVFAVISVYTANFTDLKGVAFFFCVATFMSILAMIVCLFDETDPYK